jgi:hypothetical protein
VLPAITRQNIGQLTPADLYGAALLFEALCMKGDD